jgi:hypothetical protein
VLAWHRVGEGYGETVAERFGLGAQKCSAALILSDRVDHEAASAGLALVRKKAASPAKKPSMSPGALRPEHRCGCLHGLLGGEAAGPCHLPSIDAAN